MTGVSWMQDASFGLAIILRAAHAESTRRLTALFQCIG